jgi:hypothetical protein
MSGDIERLARAHGVWVEPSSLGAPGADLRTRADIRAPAPEPSGQAETPPKRGPGRPRKSPDNLPEQGGPAPE